MRLCEGVRAVLLATLLLDAVPADAQLYESVGTRAQGMGGAFVAVADDATAAWWNPAGLASGAYFNLVIERGSLEQPDEPPPAAAASRTRTSGFSAAFPSLGVNYYRLRVSEIAAPTSTAEGADNRQQSGGASRLRSLSLSTFGTTIGQSLGDHFVVGSTIKLLRGGVAGSDVVGDEATLDAADDLDTARRTRADLDVGIMARLGVVRLGASLRNVTRPRFGDGEDQVTLVRQARAGIAALTGPSSSLDGLTLAADADLTVTPTLFGDVRHVAAGGEAWLLGKRLGVRSGITANTIGEPRRAVSTGLSFAPIKGIYLEWSRTAGADASVRGWTSTLRFTF
jgi:hypothetical protein